MRNDSNQDRRRLFDQRLTEVRSPARSAVNRHDWFADEVAIDFPSLGDVIERIRDGFLGRDDPGALRAEIRLSAREALGGVTVPLDVPVRGTCPICGGRGESWTERCGRCGGSGEIFVEHRVRLAVPAGVPDGARFRFSLNAPQALPTRVEIRVAIR